MTDLQKLNEECKGGVTIDFSPQRAEHQTADEFLTDLDNAFSEHFDEIAPDVLTNMKFKDMIVRIQAYPDTPVGFQIVHHWDLDQAVKEMLILIHAHRHGKK